MPGAWCRRCCKCPNLIETWLALSGLNTQMQLAETGCFLSTRFFCSIMFIFMLGLLLVTAFLALKTVSNVEEMLTPIPVRAQ